MTFIFPHMYIYMYVCIYIYCIYLYIDIGNNTPYRGVGIPPTRMGFHGPWETENLETRTSKEKSWWSTCQTIRCCEGCDMTLGAVG